MIHGNACFVYFNKIWDIPYLLRRICLAVVCLDTNIRKNGGITDRWFNYSRGSASLSAFVYCAVCPNA